jgi:hypothetical protein
LPPSWLLAPFNHRKWLGRQLGLRQSASTSSIGSGISGDLTTEVSSTVSDNTRFDVHVDRVRTNSASKHDRDPASLKTGSGGGGGGGGGSSGGSSGGGGGGSSSSDSLLDAVHCMVNAVQRVRNMPYSLSSLAWVLLVWVTAVFCILGAAAYSDSDSGSGSASGSGSDVATLSSSQARGCAILTAYAVSVGMWLLQQDAPLLSKLLLLRPWCVSSSPLPGHRPVPDWTDTRHSSSPSGLDRDHHHDYSHVANKALMYIFGCSRSVPVPGQFAAEAVQLRARHAEDNARDNQVHTHMCIYPLSRSCSCSCSCSFSCTPSSSSSYSTNTAILSLPPLSLPPPSMRDPIFLPPPTPISSLAYEHSAARLRALPWL